MRSIPSVLQMMIVFSALWALGPGAFAQESDDHKAPGVVRADASLEAAHKVDGRTGAQASARVEYGFGFKAPPAPGGNDVFVRTLGAEASGEVLSADDGPEVEKGRVAILVPAARFRLGGVGGVESGGEVYYETNKTLGVEHEAGTHAEVKVTLPDLLLLGGDSIGGVQVEASGKASVDAGGRMSGDELRAFVRGGLEGGIGLCYLDQPGQRRFCVRGGAAGQIGTSHETREAVTAGLDYETSLSEDSDNTNRVVLLLKAQGEAGRYSYGGAGEAYQQGTLGAAVGF